MNLLVTIDYESDVPLYKQLYKNFCEAISAGRFKAGDRVPPTRDLAKQLGLSRVTVLRCYKELLSRGHFEAGHGLGTRVSRQLPEEAKHTRRKFLSFDPSEETGEPVKVSRFAHRLSATRSFVTNTSISPPAAELPIRQWQQCVIRSARALDTNAYAAQTEIFGYRPLREAIAGVLNRSRALSCTADEIVICSGRAKALDLIARILVDRGDVVAVENPGNPEARNVFQAHGARLCPIPVDEQGAVIANLTCQTEPIKLFHTTPSHQNPSGSSMTMDRRIQLLKWARKNNTMILEDDYDCLFRFGGQSTPAIRGIDDRDFVIYTADLTNLMHPLTNAAFIVIPKQLVNVFSDAQHVLDQTTPAIESLALTEFITNGMFDMHLRNVRDTLQKRRQSLMYSLAINFRKLVQVSRNTTSTNLMVRFHDEFLSDDAYIQCAREVGIQMISTNRYYIGDNRRSEFLITFANTEPDVLAKQIAQMSLNVANFEPDVEECEEEFAEESYSPDASDTYAFESTPNDTDYSVNQSSKILEALKLPELAFNMINDDGSISQNHSLSDLGNTANDGNKNESLDVVPAVDANAPVMT